MGEHKETKRLLGSMTGRGPSTQLDLCPRLGPGKVPDTTPIPDCDFTPV